MTTRKFRLIIEKSSNNKFSDKCSVMIDTHTSFMRDTKYTMFSLQISKWMREMLGEYDLPRVKNKIEEMGKQLWDGKDGMEITIKI
jgi:hypothetical protein